MFKRSSTPFFHGASRDGSTFNPGIISTSEPLLLLAIDVTSSGTTCMTFITLSSLLSIRLLYAKVELRLHKSSRNIGLKSLVDNNSRRSFLPSTSWAGQYVGTVTALRNCHCRRCCERHFGPYGRKAAFSPRKKHSSMMGKRGR